MEKIIAALYLAGAVFMLAEIIVRYLRADPRPPLTWRALLGAALLVVLWLPADLWLGRVLLRRAIARRREA